MSEANWNKREILNPLARVSMERIGCFCGKSDPLYRFALPINTGFGTEHDAARRILLKAQTHGLTALALHSGCETIVDFPCGPSPHPFADEGLSYIGLGAPEIADALSTRWKKPGISFFLADATNPATILRGLEDARGSVCILSAGLFATLTDPELELLCDAIGETLHTHGGCWLTPDPESACAFMDILKAVCGARYADVLLKSNDMRQWKMMGQFDNTLVIDPRWDFERLRDKALAFLGRHGLNVTRIPMEPYTSEGLSISAGETNHDAVSRVFPPQYCWKITVTAAVKTHLDISHATGLDIVSESEGDLLHIKLSGRLDALSSDAFFKHFTAQADHIRAVEIDCAHLDYLSSAGLRVLLQILKRYPLTLIDINEWVASLLQMTGFDMYVQIKKRGTSHV